MDGLGPIPTVFLTHAAGVLANAFSGSQIVLRLSAFAVDWNVDIPHAAYPFNAANKRTALFEDLRAFPPQAQYQILHELTEAAILDKANRREAEELRVQLVTRYGHLSSGGEPDVLNTTLVEETRHWLEPFPESAKLYAAALEKHRARVFLRNVLDDVRLALELLVKAVLNNDKSLENQIALLGAFIKVEGGSPEFTNMFGKLVDYFTKYQNSYVKHDDAVIEEEIEFVLEFASALMKHLVRLHNRHL